MTTITGLLIKLREAKNKMDIAVALDALAPYINWDANFVETISDLSLQDLKTFQTNALEIGAEINEKLRQEVKTAIDYSPKNKAQTVESVKQILDYNGIVEDSELAQMLLKLVSPKTATSPRAENEPIKDSEGNIIQLYCLRFQKYFPVSQFGKSSKNKIGYARESKAGVKLWHHFDKLIKDIKEHKGLISESVMNGIKDLETGKAEVDECNKEIEQIQEIRKQPYTDKLFQEHFKMTVQEFINSQEGGQNE